MLVWLVPLIQLMRVRLGVCLALVVLLSGLADFILKSGHFFHLDVAFGSFAQFFHATKWFFAQIVYELVGA